MRVIKAKVLATGEVVRLIEKEDEPGVFIGDFGLRVYKADELEILEDSTTLGDHYPFSMPPKPQCESLDTTAMMKEMLDSMKGHFWRDQRVEIAKILLKRENVDLSKVAETADGIIQKLKSYGD